jgi:hypothetical protein
LKKKKTTGNVTTIFQAVERVSFYPSMKVEDGGRILTNEDEVKFPGQCGKSLWGYLRPESRHLWMWGQLTVDIIAWVDAQANFRCQLQKRFPFLGFALASLLTCKPKRLDPMTLRIKSAFVYDSESSRGNR